MSEMRNILLVIIVVLLLWNAFILVDVRDALWNGDCDETPRGKGDLHEKLPSMKPGRLTPKLPQWSL